LKGKIYPQGDSIAIYSVGTNLTGDGCIPDSDRGNLAFVLGRPRE
jgi:hypothetical protein